MNRKSGIEYGSRLGEKSEVRNRKPPKQTRGVADIEAGFGDVLGNDCASADDCSVTDSDWEDGGISADTDTVSNFSGTPDFPRVGRPPPIKAVVDKHCAMRNETIVSDGDELTDERM